MRPALSRVIVRNGSHLVFIMQGDASGDKVSPDGSVGSDEEWAEDSDTDRDVRPLEEEFSRELDGFWLEKNDVIMIHASQYLLRQ